MGERSTCRAMISQSRAASAMGYTDPLTDWLLGEMQNGGQCQKREKKLKDAFRTKNSNNHLRWGKILLP